MTASPGGLEGLRRAYEGRRVLVTGHTGFKGSWLALWLERLGAKVIGLALPPAGERPLFAELGFPTIDHRLADVGDAQAVDTTLADVDADYLFHLAAQSLVRPSYAAPVRTFQTNVMGTVHILEAARRMRRLKAAVVVTSDKCYENREWVYRYRETDPLGGADPYSASKGATELVAASYRRSYFAAGAALATARAGNVIGGGDWATDRIVPDIVRGALAGSPILIRNPAAIRPWQHVLEPLHGYLLLGARLAGESHRFAKAWNFGPAEAGTVDVATLARMIVQAWGKRVPELRLGGVSGQPHEAGLLQLENAQARHELGWQPRLSLEAAVGMTVEWYKAYATAEPQAPGRMRKLTERQIEEYEALLAGG